MLNDQCLNNRICGRREHEAESVNDDNSIDFSNARRRHFLSPMARPVTGRNQQRRLVQGKIEFGAAFE